MSKNKGFSGSIRGIAISAPSKVEGGYQGPRGGLGTPPTGSGGGGTGNSNGGSGSGGGGSKK